MKEAIMKKEYIKQVNASIDYIINHLDEELNVKKVAEQCYFSKYYFNRLFKAVTGESVYAFIKRIRIEKSAFFLKIESNTSITEIAEKYGLSSSNYSTAFKEHFGISPSEYRKKIKEASHKNAFFKANKITFQPSSKKDYNRIKKQIILKKLPDIKIIYERHKGNYRELTKRWHDFCIRTYDIKDNESLYLDISYDDPLISDEDLCIYDLCMTTKKKISGYNTMVIKGGNYAVYRFNGTLSKIGSAYQNIFSRWLPSSSCKLDNRRILSLYHSQLKDDNTIEMDICIPVK